ncbi:PKD domain protein, partial [Candidatus Magnetomorum sp. HK-1]
LSATDGELTATTSFTLTVTAINDRPLISEIADQTIDEDNSLTDIRFSVSDIEGGIFAIRAVSSNISLVSANGFAFGENQFSSYTTTVSSSQNSSITLTINPLADESGSTSITVIVEDTDMDHPLSACTSFTLLIHPVNDTPVFTAKDVSVYEDSGTQSIVNWASLSPGAYNETNDVLTFTITSSNDELLIAAPSVDIFGTSGNLNFNPIPDQNGSTVITVYLEDDGGGQNKSLSQSFTISITPVNDPPGFTKGANQLVVPNYGEPQVIQGWATNISKGPSNESSQELTFHAIANNYSLFAAGPIVQTNGTLSYTPTPDANGTANIRVYLTDNGGGNYTSNEQTFTITMETVNQPPSFTKGNNISIDEDSGLDIIKAWATNIDPGAVNEHDQQLMFNISSNHPGLFKSTLSISYTSGDLIIEPASNQNGSAFVSIVLKDNGGTANGGQDTYTEQTFTITVKPVNDPPSFTKGNNIIIKQGVTKEISHWATNISSGPPDEASQQLTFIAEADKLTLFEQAPHIGNDGTLRFKAVSSAYTGTSQVSVYLSDSGGGHYSKSTVQFFTITVTDSAPPIISEINNMNTAQNVQTESSGFTISDAETPANELMCTALSSNTDLVTNENIFIEGSGENRTVSIEPETDQTGVLDITITVHDTNGKTANETFALTIHARPFASIGIESGYTTTGTVPLSVEFTPINVQHTITNWLWNFGDNTTSTLKSPRHTYTFIANETTASFTVTLVVSGPGGTYTETTPNYITIQRPVYVDFVATSPRTGQSPLTVSFEDSSEIDNATGLLWDFGDGTDSTEQSPTHVYCLAGTYSVTLTVFINDKAYQQVKTNYVNVKGRWISGRVTASDTGDGIHNCIVEVWSGNSIFESSGLSDINGNYTITGLPLLDNLVVVASPLLASDSYFTQYYSHKDSSEEANKISVVSRNADNIDFILKKATENGICGRILQQDNNGVYNASVYVFSVSNGFGKGVNADENGYYTVSGLKSSRDYIVSAWSDVYETEYFYNEKETVSTLDQATQIIVSNGVVEGITIVIAPKGRIGGYVRTNGKAEKNVWVNAWSDMLSTGSGTLTDENGQYMISALTSNSNAMAITYVVEVLSGSHPYQAYSMATDRANSTPVTCDSFQINFDLPKGYDIAGRVTSINEEKLAGVNVSAWSKNGNGKGSAITDESGFYTITDLSIESDYIVGAFANDYPVQFFHLKDSEQQADLINLKNGHFQNANFILDKGFVIKGLIKLENQQSPAGSGINVNIWSESTSTGGDVITDGNGMFEISGLDGNASDYLISVFYEGYMPAYYDEDGTVYQRENAQYISPSENYRNLVLITGYTIKGRVSTESNIAASGIKVEAVSIVSGGWGIAITEKQFLNNANYEISGLPPGDYQVSIYPDNYVDQSTNVQVKGNTDEVNFVLQEPDRKISGTVTGLMNGKTARINVWSPSKKITKTITLEDSGDVHYEITGLKPASDYFVECRSTYYPYIIYNNASSIDDAETIDLSKADKSGIDFNLSIPTVSISGTITFPTDDISGEQVWVDVISSSSLPGGGSWVQYDGEGDMPYKVLGLKHGQYIVSATSDQYKTQFFNHVSLLDQAEIVDASEKSQTDINFSLSKGATISGKIFTSDGITGAENVYVEAMSDSTGAWAGAWTDNSGEYEIKGLETANDYKVKAEIPGKGSYYYNADIKGNTVRHISLATSVAASENSPASEINILLSAGYSISGIVRTQNNQSLSELFVIAQSNITKAGNSTFTGNDGKYTISGLPEGQDYVVTVIPEGTNYIRQSKTNIATNTVGVDFFLSTGFCVKGVVTSESTGYSINRVEMMLISSSKDVYFWARTNRLGQYTISGIPSAEDYILIAKPSSHSGYLLSSIDLVVNGDVNQNFALQSALSISGQIKDRNDISLQGVTITAFSASKNFVDNAISTHDGSYIISSVPDASDYVITAKIANYATSAKYLQSPGADIDFILDSGGSISGYVNTENGAFKGASIEISSESVKVFANTTTDSTGYYEISGLKSMRGNEMVSDYVITVNAIGYPKQTTAQKKVNDKVNFVLNCGTENEISGTVRDASGELLPSDEITVFAIAYDETKQLVEKVEVSKDGTGTFKFTKLYSDANYRLYFRPVGASSLSREYAGSKNGNYYEGTANWDDAQIFQTQSIVHFKFSEGEW